MSTKDEGSLIDHLDGVGTGICLMVAGLLMTIGDLGPGVLVGLPCIFLAIVLPMGMTYNKRTEYNHQEARRRPERDSNATYSITTKKKRR